MTNSTALTYLGVFTYLVSGFSILGAIYLYSGLKVSNTFEVMLDSLKLLDALNILDGFEVFVRLVTLNRFQVCD